MDDTGQIGVYFSNQGVRLLGTLFLARGRAAKPTVILLHGLPGIEKNFDLAIALRNAGWNCLIFHYQGCWGSQGSYNLATIPTDVLAALDHLDSGRFPQVDRDRLFLVGHSLGGWAAILAAVRDSRVRGVGVIGSGTKPQQITWSQSTIADEYTPWLSGIGPYEFSLQWRALGNEFSPVDQAQKLAGRPLLIIHSQDDEVVPLSQARLLKEASSEPVEFIVHPSGGHSFIWHRAWLIETILRWLNENLA